MLDLVDGFRVKAQLLQFFNVYLLFGYLAGHADDLVNTCIQHGKGIILPFHQDQFVIAVQGVLVVEAPLLVPLGCRELAGGSFLLRILDVKCSTRPFPKWGKIAGPLPKKA